MPRSNPSRRKLILQLVPYVTNLLLGHLQTRSIDSRSTMPSKEMRARRPVTLMVNLWLPIASPRQRTSRFLNRKWAITERKACKSTRRPLRKYKSTWSRGRPIREHKLFIRVSRKIQETAAEIDLIVVEGYTQRLSLALQAKQEQLSSRMLMNLQRARLRKYQQLKM